eukprot:6184874-Pleurochrysis_carterae.AAC.3
MRRYRWNSRLVQITSTNGTRSGRLGEVSGVATILSVGHRTGEEHGLGGCMPTACLWATQRSFWITRASLRRISRDACPPRGTVPAKVALHSVSP